MHRSDYGRSTGNKHVIQQTHNSYPFTEYGTPVTVIHYAVKFADTLSRNTEQHAILDFRAGKDVGLGMFGENGSSSVVSLGVRFVQLLESNECHTQIQSRLGDQNEIRFRL